MWPFTRKPKPLNPGPINEDWRVGDLAECTQKGPWLPGPSGPEYGDVVKVEGVSARRATIDGKPMWSLDIRGFRDRYEAACFRKVPPLNTEASAEFTAQIKVLRPAKKRQTIKSG